MVAENDRLIAGYTPTGQTLFSVAWSPNGRRIAVGSRDNTIRILDSKTGAQIIRIDEHTGAVLAVSFSPDGLRIASGSQDTTVRVWDAGNGAPILQLNAHTNDVFSVSFSPDGRRIASASFDTTVRVWDSKNGANILCLEGHKSYVLSVSFSPDSRRIASGSADDTVRVWSSENGEQILHLDGNTAIVCSVSFSPDGRRIASGSWDHTVRLWDSESGAQIFCLDGHTDHVQSVAFSPDGLRMASGSHDGTIRVWNSETGEELLCLDGNSGGIWSVAFSPDGRRLASGSGDKGTLVIWDMAGIVEPVDKPKSMGAPLERWLARQALTVGRIAHLRSAPEPDYWIPHLQGAEGEFCIGMLESESEESWAGSVAISPDGRMLHRGHADGQISAWDLEAGKTLWRIHVHKNLVQDLAMSPDGRRIASGSSDRSVRVWDSKSGTEIVRMDGHTGAVFSVAFSLDGHRIASGSADNSIRVWDSKSGTEIVRMDGHTDEVNSVAFSPDGHRIASGSDDKSIRVWDAESGTEIFRMDGHTDWVRSVSFSPDGHRIASGSDDNTVLVWEMEKDSPILRLEGHTGIVASVSFSRDGSRIASGSGDQTIRIWDAESGEMLERFSFPEEMTWRLAWAPSGAFLVSGNSNDTVRIWDTRTPEMRESAKGVAGGHSLRGRDHGESPVSGAGKARVLAADLGSFPAAWAASHCLGIDLPLSFCRDIPALLGGETPEALAELAGHPGIRRLVFLRWPGPARACLVSLLLREWEDGDTWRPPAVKDTRELKKALAEALSGEPCKPKAPAPPLGFLNRAADAVDERLATLLSALGPESVVRDPALPLRLLREIPGLPALARPQRQLLSLRVTPMDAGSAQGKGAGVDRSGFARTGPVTALVPSQLTLPEDLLLWRYLNGGLLYRARSGQEPPRLRPAIIVLDTSPACLGPVGDLIRPAAHALARTLARKAIPSAFLSAGDDKVFMLDSPTDRLRLLTHRHTALGDPVATIEKALKLLHSLDHGPVPPVALLLAHSHWGTEAKDTRKFPDLRALFVHYPNSTPRPPWADKCDRWETLRHNDFQGVQGALGRLIG